MEQKKPQRPSGSKPAGKAAKKSQSTTDYVFGWLGRQVGHVKKAVKSDVTKPTKKPAAKKPQPARPPANPPPASEQVIFRQDKVEEAELPHQPGVILRRTIIDEVVVERQEEPKDNK